MTRQEEGHALPDELSDAELDEVVRLIEVRQEEGAGTDTGRRLEPAEIR